MPPQTQQASSQKPQLQLPSPHAHHRVLYILFVVIALIFFVLLGLNFVGNDNLSVAPIPSVTPVPVGPPGIPGVDRPLTEVERDSLGEQLKDNKPLSPEEGMTFEQAIQKHGPPPLTPEEREQMLEFLKKQ